LIVLCWRTIVLESFTMVYTLQTFHMEESLCWG